MTTPRCTMQRITGTSRLVFAGFHSYVFNDFFCLVLQAANCANAEILVILLSFAADSHVVGKNFPAPVLLSVLLGVPLCRG